LTPGTLDTALSPIGWEDTHCVVSAEGGEAAVECDQPAAMPTSHTEKVPIGELLAGPSRSNFRHHSGRHGVWPKDVFATAYGQHEQLVGGLLGRPCATSELGTDADDTKLRDRARRPAMRNRFGRIPVQRGGVVLMLWHDQAHQHVDIEKTDHSQLPAVSEPIDFFHSQYWSAGPTRKNGHSALEANVGICESPQQGLHEVIDMLPRLAGKHGEPFLQRSVHGNGGVRHAAIVPRHPWRMKHLYRVPTSRTRTLSLTLRAGTLEI
jgi:hypothetical protein